MSSPLDLRGQRFGRLIATGLLRRKHRVSIWVCKCDCGNATNVRSGKLRSGSTRSCGCLAKDVLLARNTKHHMSKTRQYRIWCNMIARCYNKRSSRYKDWGGRGIRVCKRWRSSFEAFWHDMIEGYASSLSIDRINNNRNYSKSNCRWATIQEQNSNKRKHYSIKK